MQTPTPLLGMGTWGMGGRYERDESNTEESVDLLKLGLSLGLKIIDTAELYGDGLTEEIVGRAIQGTPRQEVFVITKVWRTHMQYEEVLRAAERSLARLQTSYIDLYLVHWPSPDVPLEETVRAMEKLKDDGLAREIGVSNFPVALMEEAQGYLKHSALAANEFEYNLLHQEAAGDLIPYCKTHNMLPVAYRPFAKGELTKHHSSVIDELSKKYGKTPGQIMLNWILSQGVAAIPKAGSSAHMKENTGALGWMLSGEDIKRLERT